MPLAVPPHPRNAHPLSCAFAVVVTRAKPMWLFCWLKYEWYIVTLVVFAAVWSMAENPPSPKSARVHVAFGLYHSVPLSWVPPIVKFGSVGCTASDWNCVAENPVLLRLDHVAPPSVLLKMPPSLPAYAIDGLLGAYSVAWESAWSPPSDDKNVKPSVLARMRMFAPPESAEPPSSILFASFGLMAGAMS